MGQMLGRIEEYWTNRAEGYSQVNQEELATEQKNRWLKALETEFPHRDPKDIRVLDISREKRDFHARKSAVGKCYEYQIDLRDKMEVFHRKYRFHFPHPVDIAAMEKAAEYLMGTHDFSAFTDLKEDKDTVRTIYAVGIVYEKDTLTLSWIGDGFLYHMVRILTGTLLDVGIGKIKAEEIPEILKAKDRKKSGFPAPAKGLFLGRVFYTEAELKKAVQKISEK